MSGNGGRKGRRLSKDEHSLWKGITRSVAPLPKRAGRSESSDGDPEDEKPLPRKSRPAVAAAPPPKPKLKTAPAPVSLDRRLKQKISRGSQAIDARLDLHGFTQAQAHDALLHFLRAAQAKGAMVVLVITGKGARGDGERGVLKRMVPLWLNLPEFRDHVVGFGDAGIGHGGEGALYVRLRKRRE